MKQLISILLSFLLLASSSGIAYAEHYCGDYKMMTKVTFGEEHLSCGMVIEPTPCGEKNVKAHNCCESRFTKISVDDNFNKTSFKTDFNVAFVSSIVSVFVLNIALDEKRQALSNTVYNPPPLLKDIPVLYKIFLI